jgi:hypothetical protein
MGEMIAKRFNKNYNIKVVTKMTTKIRKLKIT